MSMMQILGAFAKNLLEEDERSRQGMCEPKEPIKRRIRSYEVRESPISQRKKTPKDEDVARIANKVTRSIACHIDRMVRKRQGNLTYAVPLGYDSSPFHNVNNPFWSQPKKKKSVICHKKSYCPSCLRSYSSGKITLKNKSISKIKKGKKKKKEVKEKDKNDKEAKKEALISVERPVVETKSENLVQQPKTIWAKELLEEFREKVAKSEEHAQGEPTKQQDKARDLEKMHKAKKTLKPKLATRKVRKSESVHS